MAERRFDPTSGEWRLFAPAIATSADECALCAQNLREPYQLAVFDDAPASAAEATTVPTTDLYAVEPVAGAAETVAYTGRHDASFASLDIAHLTHLVDVWAHRYSVIGARPDVGYVHVFEDRGRPGWPARHAQGGIHGFRDIPPRARRELDVAAEHFANTGLCVSCDIVARELHDPVRIIAENTHFFAFVPFAARFPFEVHVTAHRHATSLLDLTDPERRSLAEILRTVVAAYDEIFGDPAAYSMSMRQAPTDDLHWLALSHFRVEFVPTAGVVADATTVGVGAYINATSPEDNAAQLRAVVAPLPTR
jgi:UDPglucose--hexose-1-phosphate uridylyltransferase